MIIPDTTGLKLQLINKFTHREKYGPIELAVIQSTPFCNLDCGYCYLKNRDQRKFISHSTVRAIVERIVESRLLGNELTFVWHAGEPMVAGIDFYEKTFSLIRQIIGQKTAVRHSFQTNAVLINGAWCDFFKTWDVKLGISIDGPDFIHDHYRRTRSGNGTHVAVMAAIDKLQQSGIQFHTISVLSDKTLDHPKEMFEFFNEHDIRQCAFNIEEQEGENSQSSLMRDSIETKFTDFYKKFYALNKINNHPLHVREFAGAVSAIKYWDKKNADQFSYSQELTPFRIISFDVDGNYSSFSPELLGEEIPGHGKFIFGNVFKSSLLESAGSEKFKKLHAEIIKGIRLCKKKCEYYSVCGGGTPSNKFYENGSFASSETMFCRLQRKAMIDMMLNELEEEITTH